MMGRDNRPFNMDGILMDTVLSTNVSINLRRACAAGKRSNQTDMHTDFTWV